MGNTLCSRPECCTREYPDGPPQDILPTSERNTLYDSGLSLHRTTYDLSHSLFQTSRAKDRDLLIDRLNTIPRLNRTLAMSSIMRRRQEREMLVDRVNTIPLLNRSVGCSGIMLRRGGG